MCSGAAATGHGQAAKSGGRRAEPIKRKNGSVEFAVKQKNNPA